MIKHSIILIFITIISFCNSQTVLYQDVFNGGVTADGFSVGTSYGNGIINVDIPPSSTVRKAFLLYGRHGLAEAIAINFNNTLLELSETDVVSLPFESQVYGGDNGGFVHMQDVTSMISSSDNTYSITVPDQGVYGARFVDFYLIILFESNSLPKTAVSLFVNSDDIGQFINYSLEDLFPIESTNDVGLSIHGGYMCDTAVEPTNVYVNGSNYLGKLGGSDLGNIHYCAGVIGSFQYSNSILFGIEDDNPNFEVRGTDGLSNISTTLLQGDNSLDVLFDAISPTSEENKTNPVWSVSLTYTTPCDTFSASVTSDTTLCYGETLQLEASGPSTGSGASYEWSSPAGNATNPVPGLSCADCPNPIFTADSSMFYTVRIWNNDSCSVVRPVKINVTPTPQFEEISITPSTCGLNSGEVHLYAEDGNGTVSEFYMNGVAQTDNSFTGLATGDYTFSYLHSNGCMSADTLVTVGEVNNTVADFTLSPQAGEIPLDVVVTNSSSNATDFEWFLNGYAEQGDFANFPVTITEEGTHEVMLVAWQHDPSCADTAYASVLAVQGLVVPSAFTPDGDGINDTWEILGIEHYPDARVQVFNRWGNLIFETSNYAENEWSGTYQGEKLPVGSYYFTIELKDEVLEDVKGTVSVILK